MTAVSHREVLDFWLGELDADGAAAPAWQKRWWQKDDDFDRAIRERFADCHAAICAGEREDWLDTPRGRLGYVIVLDQLSRNMFRDTPAMYAGDDRAVAATLAGLERGDDRELGYHESYFLYMPLMHAEDLELQDRCVAAFRAMAERYPDRAEGIGQAVGFAVKHRDIVARFGRFPHRNRILGRESTAEEKAFLEQPGSSF